MAADDELERIRRKKMEELIKMMQGGVAEGIVEWPSQPITVTDDNFDSIVGKYPLVVVDCWAPWCMPCRMIAPVIEELARDYAGKVVFAKLNTDENPEITMKYRIMSIPTLLIFKHGKLVDLAVGAMPRRMLEPIIKKHLS
ncbi:MAG: thioredoxin [Thermoplasmata archaeon]|nr:MAG: thioredoxin [Thermoplasmata archaeon]